MQLLSVLIAKPVERKFPCDTKNNVIIERYDGTVGFVQVLAANLRGNFSSEMKNDRRRRLHHFDHRDEAGRGGPGYRPVRSGQSGLGPARSLTVTLETRTPLQGNEFQCI